MIIGVVNANREATIRLVVHGANGQSQEIEAVIDTGFTGFLTLPSSLIALLGLSWLGRQQAMLADGVVRLFDVYGATVIWDGQLRTVETDSADTEPLLGMGMIYGHDLRIQVVSGGTVTIEALP
jgi:clan AA aspartic protease